MTMDNLHDFDIRSDTPPDTTLISQDYERFYYNVLPYLLPDQARNIVHKIRSLQLLPENSEEVVEYGASYDLKQEIQGLINAVRGMQRKVMYDGTEVRQDVTPKEMKEVVTSTTQLMNLLMKYHRELMSLDRMRALEQSTVEVLQEMGDEHGEQIVSRFVKLMEERLEEA